MNNQTFLITKNKFRQGEGELRTSTGITSVGVKKIGQLYYTVVEQNRSGLNRVICEEAWELLASYLGATLIEDPSFGNKKKKTKK